MGPRKYLATMYRREEVVRCGQGNACYPLREEDTLLWPTKHTACTSNAWCSLMISDFEGGGNLAFCAHNTPTTLRRGITDVQEEMKMSTAK